MMRSLLILGAGGHGKVVADAASETGIWNRIAFLDDRFPGIRELVVWPIIGRTDDSASLLREWQEAVVAIGDNNLRMKLLYKLKDMGFAVPAVIHPDASISRHAVIEEGAVVFSNAVVNAGARVGFGSIVNTASSVDHDCQLGEGVHLSPGVRLGGEVKIGRCTWIGIGASVIHRISIGSDVIIGTGSAVTRNIRDSVTAYGVPAKIIEECHEK